MVYTRDSQHVEFAARASLNSEIVSINRKQILNLTILMPL